MDVMAASAAPVEYPPRATDVAHAWLRSPLYLELQLEAVSRGKHVDKLAAEVLTAAIILGRIEDLLFDAGLMLSR